MSPRVAVVGHAEWGDLAVVPHPPAAGEIVEANSSWEDATGGGAVAAVQLAKLAGECLLLTALGDDRRGHATKEALESRGVRVEAAFRPVAQRRAVVFLDERGERTITTMGERPQPRSSDPLPWAELADADAVYFTAGDAGAARVARSARRLVATVRALAPLAQARVEVDVLLASAADAGEIYEPGAIDPAPGAVVRTDGARGGKIQWRNGEVARWQPAPLPAPAVDSYGAGDSFAGGLTFGLAGGGSEVEAVELGARCGAACITGRGPYEGQLPGGIS